MARPASPLFSTVALIFLVACPEQPAPRSADSADLAAAAPVNPPPAAPAPAAAVTPPTGLGALRQPAPMRVGGQAAALYEVGAFPARTIELRPGPEDDRSLVEVYCVGCHSTSYIAMQPPLSQKSWESEVQKMRGTYGAVISDPAAARIVTYLSAYYGSGR